MFGHPGTFKIGDGAAAKLRPRCRGHCPSQRRVAGTRPTYIHGARFAFWTVSSGSLVSNTTLQGALRLALLAFIHAMIRSTSGISELQSRKTSGAQAARSLSVPRACPCAGFKSKEIATRIASKPSRRGLAHKRPSLAIMTFSHLWRPCRDQANEPIRLRRAAPTWWPRPFAASQRLLGRFPRPRDIALPQ